MHLIDPLCGEREACLERAARALARALLLLDPFFGAREHEQLSATEVGPPVEHDAADRAPKDEMRVAVARARRTIGVAKQREVRHVGAHDELFACTRCPALPTHERRRVLAQDEAE